MTARKLNASAFEFSKSKLKMCFVRKLRCFQQKFNFRGITKLSGSRKRIGDVAASVTYLDCSMITIHNERSILVARQSLGTGHDSAPKR